MTRSLVLVVLLAALGLATSPVEGQALRLGAPALEVSGGQGWINSEPLTLQALRGRVVLVEFWTYG